MTKREHFERWLKQVKPNMPLDYNESEGYYYHDIVSMMWQAWQASPKARPTEPSRITKEQLDAMRADTTDIVDHLRGIYAGAASRYAVNPLMMLAADEIERLRKTGAAYLMLSNMADMRFLSDEHDNDHREAHRNFFNALNKKPA